jgi:hypothetical protein
MCCVTHINGSNGKQEYAPKSAREMVEPTYVNFKLATAVYSDSTDSVTKNFYLYEVLVLEQYAVAERGHHAARPSV